MVWKYAAAVAYLCVSERRAAGAAYGLGEGAEPKLRIQAFIFADCVLKVLRMGKCMLRWVCALMRIFRELVSGGKNGSVSFHVLFSESHCCYWKRSKETFSRCSAYSYLQRKR